MGIYMSSVRGDCFTQGKRRHCGFVQEHGQATIKREMQSWTGGRCLVSLLGDVGRARVSTFRGEVNGSRWRWLTKFRCWMALRWGFRRRGRGNEEPPAIFLARVLFNSL